MSLKYEPLSEPLDISVKKFISAATSHCLLTGDRPDRGGRASHDSVLSSYTSILGDI